MKTQKTGALFLATLLVISVFGIAIARVDESNETGSENIFFGGGSGTLADPYMIENVTQLQNMTQNLTAHYELANDIDASETSEWNWNESQGIYRGFDPIGDDDEPFTGTLDGQGHTVYDLYINRLDEQYVGLIGYSEGSLEDIDLVDVDVGGWSAVGALVGRNTEGLIFNSTSTGVVVAPDHHSVGGLVGSSDGAVLNSHASADVSGNGRVGGLIGSNDGYVFNSSSDSNVTGTEGRIGGLVGSSYYSGVIEHSHASGNVTGHLTGIVGGLIGWQLGGTVNNTYATCDVVGGSTRVGGLIGWHRGGYIKNSYAAGTVEGPSSVGGLVGDNEANVENTYAVGNVTGYEPIGGLIGDNSGDVYTSFYHEDMPECGVEGYDSLHLNDNEFDSISTFGSAGWDIEMVDTERHRPFLSWEENDDNSTWSIQETEIKHNLTIHIEGGGSTEPGEGTHVYYEHGKIVLEASSDKDYFFGNWTGDVESDEKVIAVTMDQDISVTANFIAIDYEIYDWEHLYNSRHDLQGDYTLMNDIDELSEGYDEYVDTDDGWAPIGDPDDPFAGTFHGQGYEITGLYINRSDEDHVGLYGVSEGKIENVDLVDANITGNGYVGVIAGHNDGSVLNSSATLDVVGFDSNIGGLVGDNTRYIFNSSAAGDVYGYESYVGGLAGQNNGFWWRDGRIVNSSASVNVSGDNHVGGLVGYGRDAVIENSHATGDVMGYSYRIGGLLGYNWGGTEILNSYATADVSGDENVGGLVGENGAGTIENTYAAGNVTGNTDVGGLIGLNEGTVENSFWDVNTTTQNMSDGGTGKTTEEMKDVATYTDLSTDGLDSPWDFVGNPYDDDSFDYIWRIDYNEEVNDGYPFLRWEDVDLPIYTLTTESTSGGVVTVPMEGVFLCEPHQVVDIEAAPLDNSTFIRWTGDTDTIEDIHSNSTTITMNDNYTIRALFDPVNLSIDSTENGEVVEPGEGVYEYDYGTIVDIEAVADENHHFVQWTGDIDTIDDPGSNKTTIEMLDNYNISAEFAINTYELTVDVEGEGAVEIVPDQTEYEHGTEVNLTAIPQENWTFIEWTGDYTGIESEITLTMDDDKELTAVFKEGFEFDIQLESGGDADGWNFVSFHIEPYDNDLEYILEHEEHGISGDYDKVMYFDAETDGWMSYVPGRSERFNDLDSWDNTMGVWIRVNSDVTLTVEGTRPTSTDITLDPGWNMVGFPSLTYEIAGETLPEEISKIGMFSESAEYNIEYFSDSVFDSILLLPGNGYWIYNDAEEPVTWTVEY